MKIILSKSPLGVWNCTIYSKKSDGSYKPLEIIKKHKDGFYLDSEEILIEALSRNGIEVEKKLR